MTKHQKRVKAHNTAKKTAKGRAAMQMLRVMNPASAKKVGAVRVKRLKGGGVSVVPVRINAGPGSRRKQKKLIESIMGKPDAATRKATRRMRHRIKYGWAGK